MLYTLYLCGIIPKKEVVIMSSKAQQKATAKYEAAHYDNIRVRIIKGKKEIITAHAARRGESVNGFVNRAIAETIERDISQENGAET